MRATIGHPRALAVVLSSLATTGLALAQQATLVGTLERPYRPGLCGRLEPRRQDAGDGGFRQHGPALGCGHAQGDQELRGAREAGPGRGLLARRQADPLRQPRQDGEDLGLPGRPARQVAGRPLRPTSRPWRSSPTASRPRRPRGSRSRSGTWPRGPRSRTWTGHAGDVGQPRLARRRCPARHGRQVPHHPALEGRRRARRPDRDPRRQRAGPGLRPRTSRSSSRPAPTAWPGSGNCRSPSPSRIDAKGPVAAFAISQRRQRGRDRRSGRQVFGSGTPADGKLVKEIGDNGQPVVAVALQGRRQPGRRSHSRASRSGSCNVDDGKEVKKIGPLPARSRPWRSGPTGPSSRSPARTRSIRRDHRR